MSLFKKKKNYTTVAVFDIGSHSVGGAHVLIPKKQDQTIPKAIISSYARFENPYSDVKDVKIYLKQVLDSIKKVSHTIQSSDIHTPETIYVLLRAPWVFSETKIVTYTKETPFVCTKKIVEELVDKEIKLLSETDPTTYVIEKQISSIMLNGYSVSNPYEKKTNELTISFTLTRGSKIIIDYIKEGIYSSYQNIEVLFNSIASAVYSISDTYVQSYENLFLIIAGEQLTEVGLVKQKIFYQYESFYPGIGALYKSISDKKNISIAEAYSLLEAFRLSKLAKEQEEDIKNLVSEFKALWQKKFRETITKKEYGLCLPDTCCVVSREKFSNLLADAIKNDPYLIHNCGSSAIKPLFMNESILSPHISFPEGGEFDIIIAIHALFVTSLVRYTS